MSINHSFRAKLIESLQQTVENFSNVPDDQQEDRNGMSSSKKSKILQFIKLENKKVKRSAYSCFYSSKLNGWPTHVYTARTN